MATYTYASSNVDSYYNIYSGTSSVGQVIVGDGGAYTELGFWIRKVGSPSGKPSLSIYEATGTPGTNAIGFGALVDTSSIPPLGDTITTTAQFIRFPDGLYNFHPIILEKNKKYAIVVTYSAGDASNYYQVGYDSSSSTGTGNMFTRTSAGVWTAFATQDLAYSLVSGNPTTENVHGNGSAQEVVSTGVVTTSGTASINGTNHVIMGFASNGMPQAYEIKKATLKFNNGAITSSTGSGTISNVVLYGENSSAPAGFTTSSYSIGFRKKTNASVKGSTISATQAQFETTGIDVTRIVQELVNRRDWTRTSNINFIFQGNGTSGNSVSMTSGAYGYIEFELATSTGFTNPVTGSTDTSVGTGAWSNISNIGESDLLFASANISGGGSASNILKATGYDFNIPTTAKINGISVKVRRYGTAAVDGQVRMLKAGAYAGIYNGNPYNWGGTSTAPEQIIYGGPEDLWGTTWTAADINNSNFGFSLQVVNTSGGGSAYIDSIQITVYYSNDNLNYYRMEQGWQPALTSLTAQGGDVALFSSGNQAYGEMRVLNALTNNKATPISLSRLRYHFSALTGTYGADPKTGTGGTFYDRTGTPIIVRFYNTLADAQNTATPVAISYGNLKSTIKDAYDYYLDSPITIAAGGRVYVSIEATGVSGGSEPGFIWHYGSPWTANGNVDDDPTSETYRFSQGSGYVTQSNTLFYEMYSLIPPIPDESAFPSGGSETTASGFNVQFGGSTMGGDAETTASGYMVGQGSAAISGDSKMYADRIIFSGGSQMLVSGTINPLAITKTYQYKIYDTNWNFLGVWDDVVSNFGYSQEINTAGSAINVTLARNSDTGSTTYDVIANDAGDPLITDDGTTIAAETETLNAIGPGTNVDLNLNVKIYEFSSNNLTISGDLVFTGYISMYTSQYGSTENTVVSIFSYGADLDNYLLMDGLNTRVPYLSMDPSNILRNSLSKFNTDGGIVTYSNATLATRTNLVQNPSFEVAFSDVTGYGAATVTRDTTEFRTGAYSAKVTTSGLGLRGLRVTSYINVTVGNTYTLSAYIKCPAGQMVYLEIGGYNASSSYTEGDYFGFTNNSGGWERISMEWQMADPTTTKAKFWIYNEDDAQDAPIFYVDDIMFEASDTLQPYFSGATADSTGVDNAWTGTANASTSTQTYTFSEATIADTGTLVSYTFNANTMLEVIKKCLELAPTDWFFYTDLATNKLYFQPRPSTPKHLFYLGKHILGLSLEKTMEGITNDVLFTGGTPNFVVSDTFNGTAGTPLVGRTGEVGGAWYKHPSYTASGDFTLTGAGSVGKIGLGNSESVVLNNSYNETTSDFDVSMDVTVITNQGEVGIIAAANTTAPYMILFQISGGVLSMHKMLNGTYTQLGGSVTVNPAAGVYKMRFTRNGNTLTGYWAGGSKIQVDDADMMTPTTDKGFGIRTNLSATNSGTGYRVSEYRVKVVNDTNIPKVYKRYVDNTSIAQYRRGVERIQDNRVTYESSADVIVASLINRAKNPRYRSSITISGSTYDIRSIKLGDLVGFKNFGNFIDAMANPVRMQVVRIDYTPNQVQLQLDTILPSVPKRLEDIKRNLNQEQVEDVPDAPSV